ncbi:MAG TPA: hypothetical protein VHP82_08690 [Gaiellaceae bacterium]|nr:hypothetical protein [Gaiellaceae bacterium]
MNDRLARGIGLAGIAFAGLEVAGNLSIGAFPDADAPIAKLMPFYASHHVAIARGGLLLHWAALFLALFAVALWFRIRSAHPLLAGAALLGAAVAVADELAGAGVYSTLGFLGGKESVIAPAALQAVHVNGAGGGLTTGDGGLAILLLAVAVAGIRGRAFPRWLAWSALPLGLLQLTPLGFFAEMVFLVWAVAAAIHLAARPAVGAREAVHSAAPAVG